MMLNFQSCLFAFILCLAASSASDNEWKAEIPNSVVGVSGSCVVIPCKFNYPSDGKTYSDFTGIWYKDENDVIYHKETSKINSGFKDRTSLLGDLHHKNCTLKISSLKLSDSKKYMFRIEIKDFDKYSYLKNKVSLKVTDSPEQPTVSVEAEVTTQREVTATCVVSHSCPTDPPRLTWSHSGQPKIHTQPENSQWKLTSSLTFTPSRGDHNKTLSCTAEFTGGKKVSNQKTLKVKYPPYNVNVKSKLPVKENESVEVTCSSDSNPPAHSFQWFSLTGSLLGNGPTYKLNNVSRYTEAISCTAINTEGKNSSGPQMINVLYPPYNVNVKSKLLVKENESVEVTCSSDSNPPAHSFQWFSLTGSLLGNGPTYKLNHVSRYSEAISCTAINTEGKNSSGPQRIDVLYPPEIKNESFCKSETFVVCVCIVDSNPPSQVKWFGPSSTFLSSSVQQNGSLTIFTLQGWLGFPNTIHCSASNSEGNSVMTLSAPHGLIVYVVAATAVVVVALVVISVCVAKRHCGRRPAQQRVMDMKNDQNEMKTDPKSCLDRDTNYQGNDQNVYKNCECDEADVPCEGDEDEAVYANM